jgi:hypothetical protein
MLSIKNKKPTKAEMGGDGPSGDDEDEAGRLRRKHIGKFLLNDFNFLSTLGTGTFGRVRLVKHKSEPPEAEP